MIEVQASKNFDYSLFLRMFQLLNLILLVLIPYLDHNKPKSN